MGTCLSKKSTNSSCPSAIRKPPEQIKSNVLVEKKKVEEETVKKEIFIIKHRKSQDIERRPAEEKVEAQKVTEDSESCKSVLSQNVSNNGVELANGNGISVGATVRTSSCTKEEVDAILIQCGRLSRSSSMGKAGNSSAISGSGENNNNLQRSRKYSGSKRSYDFDNENGNECKKADAIEETLGNDDNGAVIGEGSDRHRQRQRQSRTVGSPSKGRRRTPSRERDQSQGPRSGSRERNSSGSGGGRRVSRSPGRRSESPNTALAANSSASNANSSSNGRPGKMVSVPATVSSLVMDKSNNIERNETISASAVKRIQVKRNVGGGEAARTGASPRARSPARTNNVKILNENQQQPVVSLSRSNSRKAEVSPYRRNPLGEIDNNVPVDQVPLQGLKAPGNTLQQGPNQKLHADLTPAERTSGHVHENKTCITKGIVEKNVVNGFKDQQLSNAEEAKGPQAIGNNVAVNVVASGQGLTRSRSSRLSRDLDINLEALSDPAPSNYTALLLEDIQNFHQKGNPPPTFTLPACVSKARSIVEAVADLNSSTKPNLSSAFSEDKKGKSCYDNAGFDPLNTGKKGLENKNTYMQSEVVVSDDLMEPSFHKYVTVRRGGSLGGEDIQDIEEQESSGSNSFVGGPQQWVSSSSWEPDSADSTGRWTSSRSYNSREDNISPLGYSCQKQVISEPHHDAEEGLRRLSGKRRESDHQQTGIGRGRVGSRGLDRLPTAAAAST